MSGLRVVLITRRFWPLVGGGEMVMSNLASEFKALGCQPKILTAQWESSWPTEVVHREVPVYRISNPRYRGWGTFRYMVGLSRWLRQHEDAIDAVLVSMLKHSAYAALRALNSSRIPIVLRAEGGGKTGDCRWHESGRFGAKIRQTCLQAPLVVAPSQTIVAELEEAGFRQDQLEFIPNGVTIDASRELERRRSARLTLADVNPDLTVSMENPVVVFTGRLDQNKGLFELVRSWPDVRKRFPSARLWLVGDGPARERLYRMISDLEQRGAIIMPGMFDDLSEVLSAADAFVLPSYEEGMSLALLEAMMAGLPVIATDIPGNRQIVTDRETGVLIPRKNVPAIAQALIEVLGDADFAQQLGTAGQAFAESGYSSRRMAQQHLEAFERLRAN